jgi:hypothetical protein
LLQMIWKPFLFVILGVVVIFVIWVVIVNIKNTRG